MLDETVTIRFDANVAPDLPWRFEPVQTTAKVRIGENTLAFYRATNTSDRPVWGMATFNVFPEQVAPFFNKLQCFCFTEQLLQPGESVEMPVSFFVDPQIDGRQGRLLGAAHHAVLHVLSRDGAEVGGRGQGRRSCDTGSGATQGASRVNSGSDRFAAVRSIASSRAAAGGSGSRTWPTRTPSITTTTW